MILSSAEPHDRGPDPAARGRLTEIIKNLADRISEARINGWLGEVEGLQVSLTAARAKVAALDRTTRNNAPGTADLGMPALRAPRPAGGPVNSRALRAALTACAVGIHPDEAAVALLIHNGTFLRRDDFTSRFIEHGTSSGTPMARRRLGRRDHRPPLGRAVLLSRRETRPGCGSEHRRRPPGRPPRYRHRPGPVD